jgi:peptidoglycan/xylan/chitin deacetylase (PgdA/CDA1 family)
MGTRSVGVAISSSWRGLTGDALGENDEKLLAAGLQARIPPRYTFANPRLASPQVIERIPAGGVVPAGETLPGLPVTGADRTIVVRRRDVDRQPRPVGGDFAARRIAGIPLPGFVSGLFSLACADTTERVIALTFDDGPHPEHTPRILDALADHGAVATFFVLAGQAEAHPGIVRRIVAEGHQVALHGLDHRSLLTMTAEGANERIARARRSVENIAAIPITLYRPPYGQNTFRQAAGIRRQGLENVAWSSDAVDWIHDNEYSIAGRAIGGVFPGAIILLHDNRGDPESIGPGEELPRFDRSTVVRLLLAELDRRGYRTLTVDDLRTRFTRVRSAAIRTRPAESPTAAGGS